MASLVGLSCSGTAQLVSQKIRPHRSEDTENHDLQLHHTQAMEEVQTYADFQEVLSNSVANDLSRDVRIVPADRSYHPPLWNDPRGDFPYISDSFNSSPLPPLPPSAPLNASFRLPQPVFIPQRRPGDNRRGWIRAYAPSLMNCGIKMESFLSFLDDFNEVSKTSPYLHAVSAATLGVSLATGLGAFVFSMAVPLAIKSYTKSQARKKSVNILKLANKHLFSPHGLLAVVVTFNPEKQTESDRSSSLSSSLLLNGSSKGQGFTLSQGHLRFAAPLFFPGDESMSFTDNTFLQLSSAWMESRDRKAQEQRTDSLNSSFNSSCAPASFIPNFEGRNDNAKFDKVTPQNQSNSKKSTLLSGGIRAFPRKRKVEKQSSSGDAGGPPFETKGQKHKSLKRKAENASKSDTLYLMIVNDPASEESSEIGDRRRSPSVEEQLESMDLGQQNWMGHGTTDAEADDMAEMGSHTTKSGEARARNESLFAARRYNARRRQGYCIPTL